MSSEGDDGDRLFGLAGIPKADRKARLSQARDDIVAAREFGGWTLSKLEVLTRYFSMYRRVAGGGTYIDGFAGEGHAIIRGEVVDGSPLRAAESGAFRDLYLFEFDQRCHRRLRAALDELPDRVQVKCHLRPRADVNVALPALLEQEVIPVDRPCFAFLDPNSTELAWDTVAALSQYKPYIPGADGGHPQQCKVEVWILLNTHQALNRLLPRDRTKHQTPPFADTIDFVMGGRKAWWDLWRSPTAAPASLAYRYADRLVEELGYKGAHAQQVLDPDTHGRPVYFMIHASDHPNAHSIMRSAKKERMRHDRPFPGL